MSLLLDTFEGTVVPPRNGRRVLCYLPAEPYAYRWRVLICRDDGAMYFDDDLSSRRFSAAAVERWAYLPEKP